MEVKNPFRIIDDFLLDWVFNPFAWWLEYHFGKDAAFASLYVKMAGWMCLLVLAIKTSSPVLLVLAFAGSLLTFLTGEVMRSIWLSNNKTGKNIKRVSGFPMRMLDFVLVTYMTFSMFTAEESVLFVSIVTVIATLLTLVVPEYLDATDKMPPMYGRFKTVGQN